MGYVYYDNIDVGIRFNAYPNILPIDYQRLDNVNEWLFFFVVDRIIDLVFSLTCVFLLKGYLMSGETICLMIHCREAIFKGFSLLTSYPFSVSTYYIFRKINASVEACSLGKNGTASKVGKFYGAVEKQLLINRVQQHKNGNVTNLYIIDCSLMACALYIVFSLQRTWILGWIRMAITQPVKLIYTWWHITGQS